MIAPFQVVIASGGSRALPRQIPSKKYLITRNEADKEVVAAQGWTQLKEPQHNNNHAAYQKGQD